MMRPNNNLKEMSIFDVLEMKDGIKVKLKGFYGDLELKDKKLFWSGTGTELKNPPTFGYLLQR